MWCTSHNVYLLYSFLEAYSLQYRVVSKGSQFKRVTQHVDPHCRWFAEYTLTSRRLIHSSSARLTDVNLMRSTSTPWMSSVLKIAPVYESNSPMTSSLTETYTSYTNEVRFDKRTVSTSFYFRIQRDAADIAYQSCRTLELLPIAPYVILA